MSSLQQRIFAAKQQRWIIWMRSSRDSRQRLLGDLHHLWATYLLLWTHAATCIHHCFRHPHMALRVQDVKLLIMPWLPIAESGIDAGSTRSCIPWASQRPSLSSSTIATAGETRKPFSTLLRPRDLVRQACLCKRWPAEWLPCHQRQQDGAQAVTESFSATLMCTFGLQLPAASRICQRPLCPSSIAPRLL